MCHCYICYAIADEEWVCDRCEENYCEVCSYMYTLHYQHQGSRCYQCADQTRRLPLERDKVRENKINFLFKINN